MKATVIGLTTALMLLPSAASRPADAQPSGKVYRVGFIVTPAQSEIRHLSKELEEGLRELGYSEGRNLVLERRFAEGRPERLPTLAAELARFNVDVIVTGSNPVIAAVKQATGRSPSSWRSREIRSLRGSSRAWPGPEATSRGCPICGPPRRSV